MAACSEASSLSQAQSTVTPVAEASARAVDVGLPPERVDVRLRKVADGFSSPLGVTGAGDGKSWLYVVEQDGLIRVFRDGRIARRPFIDVSDKTEGGGEQGLLGLAFHPDYADNGRFYVNYTDRAGDTVVAEYLRSRTAYARARPSSERVLLQVDQPFSNHNGGGLAFGPDGHLYIALGDGGSAGDPQGHGQRKDTLLGKILRVDVSARDGYGIPDDNPFTGDPAARGEIWAYGLRNPWRITFDRATGDLWIGDVGQGMWEEVDREAAGSPGGLNYGWNVKEGRECYPAGDRCELAGVTEEMVDPVTVYSHDDGCSITGGYVYRGRAYPVLQGNYLFSDYCSGTIWGISAEGPAEQEPVVLRESGLSVSSFGEGDAGELYLVDLAAGGLYRVRAVRR